jgi:hypothetical protein
MVRAEIFRSFSYSATNEAAKDNITSVQREKKRSVSEATYGGTVQRIERITAAITGLQPQIPHLLYDKLQRESHPPYGHPTSVT